MKPIYKDAVVEMQAKGITFNKNPFELSNSETSILRDVAAKYGYRRSKYSYLSTGRAFYECLKKVYNKINK